MERKDVRMLKSGRNFDLAKEAFGAKRGAELRPQDLHSDLAPMLQILGEVNDGHAAAAELALEPVRGAERGLNLLTELGRHDALRWQTLASLSTSAPASAPVCCVAATP